MRLLDVNAEYRLVYVNLEANQIDFVVNSVRLVDSMVALVSMTTSLSMVSHDVHAELK